MYALMPRNRKYEIQFIPKCRDIINKLCYSANLVVDRVKEIRFSTPEYKTYNHIIYAKECIVNIFMNL